MTLTAISPRLAMRTFFSTLRLSNRMVTRRWTHAPRSDTTLSRPVGCVPCLAPGSADIRCFDSIDSTNRYLLEEARKGAADGVVAVADHQTAGRGRLGRRWEAPGRIEPADVGAAAPSSWRRTSGTWPARWWPWPPSMRSPRWSGLELGIKWPNDLLAPDGRKVAGVLAEADLAVPTGASAASTPPIVVGIGINVNWPVDDGDLPDELAGSATSLFQQSGRGGRPVRALRRPCWPPWSRGWPTWERQPGRSRQATRLPRPAASRVGTRVRVELADGLFEGIAVEVTADGPPGGGGGRWTRTVIAGDVVHVRPGA